MKYFLEEIPVLVAKGDTGIGTPHLVKDWQHLLFALSSQSSANFTIKFQGSFSKVCPNFGTAQTATNRWDYIQVKDYQNNAAIDGDTGVSFAGTDDVRMFELNTNGLNWVCAVITARSAGSANLMLSAYSNN
jgi:hypothetical protein